MGLVYFPTFGLHLWGKSVDKYTFRPMDPMSGKMPSNNKSIRMP